MEVPTQPWYVAMVLASKVYSRREIRRIVAGLWRVVLVEVFKVLSQNRIQQRLWSRSLTFQLAEVFQIFMGQGSSSSSRLHDDADEDFTRSFTHFSPF